MLRLLKPNLVRRFSNTNSKTNFTENNKAIEDLIKKQNETLNNIYNKIRYVGLITTILTLVLTFYGLISLILYSQ